MRSNLWVLPVVLLGMGSYAFAIVHREFALPPGCDGLASIHVASAENDAETAIAATDFHLFSVGGASPLVPGLADSAAQDRYSVQPIACSGGSFRSRWHLRLAQDARVYAEHYNAVILRALEENAGQSQR